MKNIMKLIAGLLIFSGVTACSPEIGSEAWCMSMKEKPKGDWSVNEATDFTRYCVFK